MAFLPDENWPPLPNNWEEDILGRFEIRSLPYTHDALLEMPEVLRRQAWLERAILSAGINWFLESGEVAHALGVSVGLRVSRGAVLPELAPVILVPRKRSEGELKALNIEAAPESIRVGDMALRVDVVEYSPVALGVGQKSFPFVSPAGLPIVAPGTAIFGSLLGTLGPIVMVDEGGDEIEGGITAGHVAESRGRSIIQPDSGAVIGTCSARSSLDAAIVRLDRDRAIPHPVLPALGVAPASLIEPMIEMPVQALGGESGWKTTHIRRVDLLAIDLRRPAYGNFESRIVTSAMMKQGDSGALLVSGWGLEPAIPPHLRAHVDPSVLHSHIAGALAILVNGSPEMSKQWLAPADHYVALLPILEEFKCTLMTR